MTAFGLRHADLRRDTLEGLIMYVVRGIKNEINGTSHGVDSTNKDILLTTFC